MSGPPNDAAELVLAELRLRQLLDDAAVGVAGRVEVVGRVERVVAVVLEERAAEAVRARLGDDADLAAGAGAELRRVVVRLDAELLHVLEARLQLERRGDLAGDVARRGVDDGRALDAVELDHVLLVGAAAEADVVPGAGAGVLRAGRLQHQLRHLAAVDRQARWISRSLTLTPMRAELTSSVAALPCTVTASVDARRLQRQVERELLRRDRAACR